MVAQVYRARKSKASPLWQCLTGILQKSVDEQIVHPGFIPGNEEAPACNVVQMPKAPPPAHTEWRCSPKQKELILKLVSERGLDRNQVDDHSRQRFNKGVVELDKLEASGLIDAIEGRRPCNGGPWISRAGSSLSKCRKPGKPVRFPFFPCCAKSWRTLTGRNTAGYHQFRKKQAMLNVLRTELANARNVLVKLRDIAA